VARQIAAADAFAVGMAPAISDLRTEGYTTVRALTGELNNRGVPTARGGHWDVRTVHRLLKRIEVIRNAA